MGGLLVILQVSICEHFCLQMWLDNFYKSSYIDQDFKVSILLIIQMVFCFTTSVSLGFPRQT